MVVVVAPHVPLQRPRVGAAHLSPAPRGAAQRRRPVGRRSAGDCVAVAAAGGGGECCEGGKKGEIMSRGLPPTAPSPGFLPATRPVTFYNRDPQHPSPAPHRVAPRAPPASPP